MTLRPYLDHLPQLGERVYVDPAATVIGDVVLGDDSSLWPGTVVRGDVNFIRIGARCNLQDGAIVHVSHDGPHAKLGGFATHIGNDVTIGHGAIIHACVIEDACLIGMGAIVLGGAVVHKHGFVGAGAMIAPGKVVGSGELAMTQKRGVRSEVPRRQIPARSSTFRRLRRQRRGQQRLRPIRGACEGFDVGRPSQLA